MKKKILTLTLFLLSAITFAGEKKVLSLLMTDGTNVCFYLSEQPLVKFVDEKVKIVSVSEEVLVSRASVDRFEFLAEVPTGIEEIEMEEDKMDRSHLELSDEAVGVSGLPTGGIVRIFSLKGQMLASATADADGRVMLSLESLPSGIYLINYNNTTIKFIKR